MVGNSVHFCARRPSPPGRSWLAALLLSLAVGWPELARAAAFEFKDDSWEGGNGLYAIARSVAQPERVRLSASIDYGRLTPADALLIVHPMVPLDDAALSAFIQSGGRVAVLDDFGESVSFLERFQIRRLAAPPNPTDTLRGNRNLPIAYPVGTRGAANSVVAHPITRDVDRVVLNHPTVLTNPGLTGVLELRSRDTSQSFVALTGVVGDRSPGRLLVMSDPSAVMNLMLRYPGNRNFAHGLIRYLTEDDGRAKKGTLYILANRFDQSGHYGNAGAIAAARQSLDQLLRELRHGIPKWLLVLLAATTLLGVIHWAYRHAIRLGAPHVPRLLRAVPLTAQAGWPGRAAALMSKGTPPALALLELRAAFRERLASLTLTDPGATSAVLVEQVARLRLLDGGGIEQLRVYLSELDAIERATTGRRMLRIRKPTLSRLVEQGIDIVEHLRQVESHRREPSPASE